MACVAILASVLDPVCRTRCRCRRGRFDIHDEVLHRVEVRRDAIGLFPALTNRLLKSDATTLCIEVATRLACRDVEASWSCVI